MSLPESLRRLALLSASFALAACGSADATARTADGHRVRAANQYIVAIDLSGSRNGAQLRQAQGVADAVIGQLANGDRLAFLEVDRDGLAGEPQQWMDTVRHATEPGDPMPSELAEVDKVRTAARSVLPMFFDPAHAGRVNGTDIFSTLVRVGDYAHGESRRTTLYLLSDMLQAGKGVNMERAGGVPSAAWLERQKSAGVLPALDGVCVVVLGADPSTARGAKVREFWKRYFAATGAEWRDGNYRNAAVGVGGVGCG